MRKISISDYSRFATALIRSWSESPWRSRLGGSLKWDGSKGLPPPENCRNFKASNMQFGPRCHKRLPNTSSLPSSFFVPSFFLPSYFWEGWTPPPPLDPLRFSLRQRTKCSSRSANLHSHEFQECNLAKWYLCIYVRKAKLTVQLHFLRHGWWY